MSPQLATRKVLIVGSGADAWLVAAGLDAAVNTDACRPAAITVLEPPGLPAEAGAEALTPGVRDLLALLGCEESDFLRRTGGTFRLGAKLQAWLDDDDPGFYLPFERQRLKPIDESTLRWLRSDRSIPFAFTVSAQPALCERLAGPMPVPLDATTDVHYGYHVDRGRFAVFLRQLAEARGTRRKADVIADVAIAADGSIDTVTTTDGTTLTADLFIDCSGDAAVLIGEALGVDWIDCSDWLPADRTLALSVPYEQEYPGYVRPNTIVAGGAAGWIRETPLLDRREWLYAYSGALVDADAAERELRAHVAAAAPDAERRERALSTGYRAKAWAGNCVAIGGAAAGLAPLAVGGLTLTQHACLLLAEHFPVHGEMAPLAYRYNRLVADAFHEVLDFSNLHYALSNRRGSDYWLQAGSRVRERNRARLDYWRIRPPAEADFEDALFPGEASAGLPSGGLPGDHRPPLYGAGLLGLADYESLLFGMDFLRDECDAWFGTERPPSAVLDTVARQPGGAASRHEALLRQVCGMPDYAVS